MNDLTWTCHICKKERPDHLISVITKPLFFEGRRMGDFNIRYCNDSKRCQQKALEAVVDISQTIKNNKGKAK
jgi:hypothetical protein